MALLVLVLPHEARIPLLIVAGLALVGGAFFLGMLIFGRDSLETSRSKSASSTASRGDRK